MRATTTIIAALALVGFGHAASAQVPINAFDNFVTESASTACRLDERDVLPAGPLRHIFETGTSSTTVDQKAAAGDGTSNAGNTYSAGTTGSTERALGILQSGSNLPRPSAPSWPMPPAAASRRWPSSTPASCGVADRVDRIDFQYSLDATSLLDWHLDRRRRARPRQLPARRRRAVACAPMTRRPAREDKVHANARP
ncbi:MAG: hypothetical protein U1F43_37815 [Myxococcota bacterium]